MLDPEIRARVVESIDLDNASVAMTKTADIRALLAALDEAEGALRPFAKVAWRFMPDAPEVVSLANEPDHYIVNPSIKIGDLRRARSILTPDTVVGK